MRACAGGKEGLQEEMATIIKRSRCLVNQKDWDEALQVGGQERHRRGVSR